MAQEQPSQTNIIVSQGGQGPGCLVQGLWFLAIGWWLSGFWIVLAWILTVLVITMPVGLAMINRTPKIATLADPSREFTAVTQGTATVIQQTEKSQRPMPLRVIYFVLVGWWFSAIWLFVAWSVGVLAIALILLVVTAPIGIALVPLTTWMYNQVPAVTTLKRY